MAMLLLLPLFCAPLHASQCVGGPCGPGREQCGPMFPAMPRYHIKDVSCDENDPNGPFYDEVHGIYHLFFQDHLAQPGGGGPVWGHVASRNLSHWTRLPVAIWNGPASWDSNAIFTGSVTIVDGKPVVVYSGRGPTGGYCTATPANGSDPLYKLWSKTDWAANPVMQGDDDPSTAWKTADGEWRLTGNGDGGVHCARNCSPAGGGCAPIYASTDFKNWSFVGHTNLPVSECPSLFPLPPLTPGTRASPGEPMPTHVHKWAHWHQFGRWVDGAPGVGDKHAGLWTTMGGATVNISDCGRDSTEQTDDQCQLYDHGAFYAAKDFWDPVQRRRINWGWARTPHGAQTMPRSLTYHPQLQQLVSSPLDESSALRMLPPLAEERDFRVNNSAAHSLGRFGARTNSSELRVFVRRPAAAAVVTISVAGVHAGITCGPAAAAHGGIASVMGCTGCLRLLPTEDTLELRLFVDQTVAESYYQGGRVAYTSSVRSLDPAADAFLSSNTSIVVMNATLWEMGDQWISEEELLATPRVGPA